MTKKDIQQKLPEISDHDLEQTLEKVGDRKDGKWELRKNFYKELDVYSYEYSSAEVRQQAIDNAVKIYDKMRLSASDPEWDRLLAKSERGTGKCLSKLQASIVSKGPKITVENAESGRDTPLKDEDLLSDKSLSKAKGEGTARSSSQEPALKKKKMTETEAQSKRLFSKNPSKAAVKVPKAAPKSAPKEKTVPKAIPRPSTKATAKKTIPAKPAGTAKPLSSEFINESDDDDNQPAAAPKPVQKKVQLNKRPREEEVDTSDSSVPLRKKIRKEEDAPIRRAVEQPNHRVSDASQNSRTTNSSSFSQKTKSNSPTKSSPLASSPPTNASEFDNSSGGRTSSSASPAAHNGKSRSPIHKRHQKSSSVTSSSSAGSNRYLKPEVTDLARRFKVYYPKYQKLHAEVEKLLLGGGRDEGKERDLVDMHSRLQKMKEDIVAGIVEY